MDVAPTLMDLMGQKPLAQFMNESLVPEMFGATPKQHDPIVLELAEDTHNPHRRAVISGDYKLIVFGHNEGYKRLLFNLKDDPNEQRDLSEAEPKKLEEMRALLKAEFAKIPSIAPYGGMRLKEGSRANGPMGPTDSGT
jgi:arylsulfatase A-like enzyme